MTDTTLPKPPNRRLWIPTLLIIAYGGLHLWVRQSEHMMGPAFVFLGTLLLFLLLWFWGTFLTGQRLWVKFVSVFGLSALIAFLVTSLRYEGSTDGTGLPNFTWKWNPTLNERSVASLEELPDVAPAPTDTEAAIQPLKYQAADSLEYYGPTRRGVFPDYQINREALENPLQVIWRHPIGLGWSAFAVKGRLAITQEQRDEEEWVTAYDLETGELQWSYAQARRFSEAMGGDGPRATPSIHGETVYALGATGVLDALNLADGTHKWSYNALADGAGNITWGKSASPIYLEEPNLVVVTGGSDTVPTVQAVHAETGETAWTWGTDAASYASPILASIHGETQLISVNENTVVGLVPESGELRWQFDWPKGMVQPSAKVGQPTVIDESKVLVTASYGVGSFLFEVLKDETGSMTTETVWRSRNRMKTKFSSACVVDGYAYGLDEGMFACQDIATGKRIWKDGRYKFGQNIIVGDVAVVQKEDGGLAFVDVSPEKFTELAVHPGIEGKTWNVPTFAGEYLLIRNDREAACIRLPLVTPEQ
jgi:outer membrane protein assembly factor BamB